MWDFVERLSKVCLSLAAYRLKMQKNRPPFERVLKSYRKFRSGFGYIWRMGDIDPSFDDFDITVINIRTKNVYRLLTDKYIVVVMYHRKLWL